MRPLYQVQTISPLLKHLESLRDVINPLSIDLNHTIFECQSWLKDDDRKTFKEMMLELEDITSSIREQMSALLDTGVCNAHLNRSESSGQREANISSINPPISSTNVVQDKTCIKFVTIEEFQSLLHKLDTTAMTTGSLERKYLQIEENINTVNDKLTRFEGELKSQAQKSKQHDRRIDEVQKDMEELREKVEVKEEWTRQLPDNIKKMMTSIQEINETSSDDRKHIEELEVITKDLVKTTQDFGTSVQEMSVRLVKAERKILNGDSKTGAMCQVLAKRFSQFESLHNVFNQLMKSREANSVQLLDKHNTLDIKYRPSGVAFSASIQHELSLITGDVISKFGNVLCNTGGCFKPTTGEFTAPTDGLYCISFNLDALVNGKAIIALYRKRLSTKTKTSKTQEPATPTNRTDKKSGYDGDKHTEDVVNSVRVSFDVTQGSRVTVLELQKGDKLYLKVYKSKKLVTFSGCSLFTCFQICC